MNVIDRSTIVEITNFEKRYEKQKFYVSMMRAFFGVVSESLFFFFFFFSVSLSLQVYEIHVSKQRENGVTEDMFIFRRYSEFLDLSQALERQFPDAPFPPFPPKIYLRRSSVRTVAMSRMQDLDYYLKVRIIKWQPNFFQNNSRNSPF